MALAETVLLGSRGVDFSREAESSTPVFPWANRSEPEWKKLITRNEASRLFFLASNSTLNPFDGPNLDWINNFCLNTAFSAFWKNDLNSLRESVEKANFETNQWFENQELIDHLSAQAEGIFSDQRLYLYLITAGLIFKARKTNGNVHQAAALRLGLDENSAKKMYEGYQKMVEIFSPTATMIARRKARKGSGEFDEFQEIAQVENAENVLDFYWETLALNPPWTIKRFFATTNASLKGLYYQSQKFDTRGLEISVDPDIFASAAPTGEETLFRTFGDVETWDMVRSATPTKNHRMVIGYKFLGFSNSEIAEKLGIPRQQVKYIVAEVRQCLRTMAKDTGIRVPEKRVKDKSYTWDELFAQIKKYEDLYFGRERRMALSPFHRDVLDAFFAVQTGNKESAIDKVLAVLQEKGHKVKRDSIRRHVIKGIYFLARKEDSELKNPERRWEKFQQAKIFCSIYNTPTWEMLFNTRERYALKRYFVDWMTDPKHQTVTNVEIAWELGVDQGTVSRIINRSIKRMRQFNTSFYSDEDALPSKARHNLPK